MRRLLLAVWLGALVMQAALVAPTLFTVVADRRLAGTIAGALFRRLTFASTAIAVLLALAALWSAPKTGGRRQALWLLAPALLLLASEYAVRPLVAAARLAGAGGAGFALWHGVSTALYAVALGIVLCLTIGELRR